METPTTDLAAPEASPDYQRLFDYQVANVALKRLVDSHSTIVRKAERNRKIRKIDIDVDRLRERGLLNSDETFIPIRVIDSNIKREQPSLVAFFTQSYRAAIFKPHYSNRSPSNLEKAFTDGVRYTGWEIPFYKCIDGAQLHGRDAIEIEYDETKPFKIGFAHIGYENLIFQDNVHRIEDCEKVIIRYPGQTAFSLREKVVNYGFNSEQVENKLLNNSSELQEDKTYTIYKVYFKYKGIVYIAWFAPECDDWLKPPKPFWLGRANIVKKIFNIPNQLPDGSIFETPTEVPTQEKIYETLFPVKLYIYKLSEDKNLSEACGRAFEDEYKQTAQTALWTAFVNGTVRASGVYASPAGDDSGGASIAQLDVKLEHGKIYNKKLDFWHTDYPPLQIVDAAGRLNIQAQEDSGQIAYTVLNRKDTEKTATELNLAREQSNLLSSVQVTLLASFFRDVYSHTWLIVQSLALQGIITLKDVSLEELSDLYEIETAGTTDVLEREERLRKRLNMWQIVSTTPLASTFLIDILREMFPQDAQRYEQILIQGSPKNKVIQDAVRIIESLVMGPDNKIKPEYAQFEEQLTQFAQQAAQVQQSPL